MLYEISVISENKFVNSMGIFQEAKDSNCCI